MEKASHSCSLWLKRFQAEYETITYQNCISDCWLGPSHTKWLTGHSNHVKHLHHLRAGFNSRSWTYTRKHETTMSEDHWSDLFLVAFLSNTSIKPKRNTMHKSQVRLCPWNWRHTWKAMTPSHPRNDSRRTLVPKNSEDSRPVLNAFSQGYSPLVAPTMIWIHTHKV